MDGLGLHSDRITQLQDSVEKLNMCFVNLLACAYKDSVPTLPKNSKEVPLHSSGNQTGQDLNTLLQETTSTRENIYQLLDSLNDLSLETPDYEKLALPINDTHERLRELIQRLEQKLDVVNAALTTIGEDIRY